MRDPGAPQYSERVIHGEIYKARPDVMSVCHHHSPAFMPLLATGTDYMPIFHLGAVGGIKPPFWDQHDEFGDTNMLVVKPEEGASLARALGQHWMVLMSRHGVTVVGTSVRDCVFRSRLFRAQCRVSGARHGASAAHRFADAGRNRSLAGSISGKTTGRCRSWEYWAMRVAKARRAAACGQTSRRARQSARASGKKRRR